MTTNEMQKTFNEFRSKYPGYRGLDLKSQREILDGIKVIVKTHNHKFMIMTKEEVAPGGRLDKMRQAAKAKLAFNRKVKKEQFNSLPDEIKQIINMIDGMNKVLNKINKEIT